MRGCCRAARPALPASSDLATRCECCTVCAIFTHPIFCPPAPARNFRATLALRTYPATFGKTFAKMLKPGPHSTYIHRHHPPSPPPFFSRSQLCAQPKPIKRRACLVSCSAVLGTTLRAARKASTTRGGWSRRGVLHLSLQESHRTEAQPQLCRTKIRVTKFSPGIGACVRAWCLPSCSLPSLLATSWRHRLVAVVHGPQQRFIDSPPTHRGAL